MNRNQARALHIRNFRGVLDEIEESHRERFERRYSGYLCQIGTVEEARAAFNVSSGSQETEQYWVIEFWQLITSRVTTAELRDYTIALALGIVYTDDYFLQESATLLTYNRERLELYRAEEEREAFFSQFFPSW